MNERLLELAIEARKYAETKPDIYQVAYDKKFAELIIKKCISQIALIGISNFENNDIAWTVETAIDKIQEHFGVKE